jgi:hypothetical protein
VRKVRGRQGDGVGDWDGLWKGMGRGLPEQQQKPTMAAPCQRCRRCADVDVDGQVNRAAGAVVYEPVGNRVRLEAPGVKLASSWTSQTTCGVPRRCQISHLMLWCPHVPRRLFMQRLPNVFRQTGGNVRGRLYQFTHLLSGGWLMAPAPQQPPTSGGPQPATAWELTALSMLFRL